MGKVKSSVRTAPRRRITGLVVFKAMVFAGLCYTVPQAIASSFLPNSTAFNPSASQSVQTNQAPFQPLELAQSVPQSQLVVQLAPGNAGRVEVRSQPSIRERVLFVGNAGDRGQVLDQRAGNDGYTWYYLRFEDRRGGWVRSDALQSQSTLAAAPQQPAAAPAQPTITPTTTPSTNGGIPRFNRPSRSTAPVGPAPELDFSVSAPPASAPAPQPEAPSNPISGLLSRLLPPREPAQTLSQDQVERYFQEVALGSEFGSANAKVRRWNQDLRIAVHGNPTDQDLQTLTDVVDDLNALIGHSVRLSFTNANPNTTITFAPESQFRNLDPNYRPRNLGFFWTTWDSSNHINSARILVSTTGVSQQERSHLIREELTQVLGLMQDSLAYPDSIFYQGWTETTQYAPIDRAIIQLLYSSAVTPGMNRAQAEAALRQTDVLALISR
ncbi:MAG: DUF2927 domain-containing protein [Kaiparowitsia implicata GSE-PSE-MK54-09C]|nr:DUF2927 domain-containing protein [Kaiparowitsia implicata GSE-PSE-MK54-09C]